MVIIIIAIIPLYVNKFSSEHPLNRTGIYIISLICFFLYKHRLWVLTEAVLKNSHNLRLNHTTGKCCKFSCQKSHSKTYGRQH